ncbi:hypothetical protein [Hymenobacter coccineus]|uniref:hypothetical protein n=1 Tax=Hymenobacter coccineus TaxID=1908235 RepID=UPI000B2D80B0|nr:hypothetical protein [Hymenobacter coccineus]
MLSDPFSSAAAEVLITQAPDFVGIYDVAAGWFMRVNPAGVRLLGYPSEEAFLADPARCYPPPPCRPPAGRTCASWPGARGPRPWRPR